jgi:hypothetical protein
MVEILSKVVTQIDVVQKNLPSIFADALLNNEDQIIDLNVDQLRRGLTSEGEPIEPEYATDEYAQLKKALGSKAPSGTPDLILEGDFTEAFYIEKRGDGILFDSRDEKTDKLDRKYDDTFGLTDQSKKVAMQLAEEEIVITIENEMFK